jgi:hypothetical protein
MTGFEHGTSRRTDRPVAAKRSLTTPNRTLRDALVVRIREALATRDDVREVNMFGGVSFMVAGRMAVAAGRMAVAAGRDGGLLVRTVPAEYDVLLRRGAAPAYMGVDRPMGEGWVTVQAARVSNDVELAFWVAVGLGSGTST